MFYDIAIVFTAKLRIRARARCKTRYFDLLLWNEFFEHFKNDSNFSFIRAIVIVFFENLRFYFQPRLVIIDFSCVGYLLETEL